MIGKQIASAMLATVILCVSARQALAEEATTAPGAVAMDAATQKRVDGKVNKLLKAVPIDDADKAARVKTIIGNWLVVMWKWHSDHDVELGSLWKQWSQARAGVQKDEFPAEVIGEKLDGVYASLKPEYQKFATNLATEMTSEQIDAFKEAWSRSPGMKRTYNAYLEIVPDLTDADKKWIHDRMFQAREDAMLTDSEKEIINIYKRHKVKVQEYVGALEWDKLLKAYVNRGKASPSAPAASTRPE